MNTNDRPESGGDVRVPGYHVQRRLGSGATSSVWAAYREQDLRRVALKVLPGVSADEDAVREFTVLQHAALEHVVACHGVESATVGGADATAIVLDLCDGGDLRSVVTARATWTREKR